MIELIGKQNACSEKLWLLKGFGLCLLLLFMACLPVLAQVKESNFHLRQFTDENGLPQNSIQGLAFDNLGFVWIGTQGGLVRFDGQKFVTYTKKDLSVESDRFISFKSEMNTGAVFAVNERRQLVSMSDGVARYKKKIRSDYDLDLAAVRARPSSIVPAIEIDTIRNAESFMQYRVIFGSPGRYYLYADEKIGFFEKGVLTAVTPLKGPPVFAPLPPEPHLRQKSIRETKKAVHVDNLMAINGNLFYHEGSEGIRLLHVTREGMRPLELNGDITENKAFATLKDKVRIITNRLNGQAFAYLAGCVYQIIFSEQTGTIHTRLLIEGLDLEQKLIYRMLYDESNRILFMGSVSQGLFVARASVFQTFGQVAKNSYNTFFYAQLPFSDSTVLIPEGFVIGRKGILKDLGSFFREGKRALTFGMLADRAGSFWIIKGDSVCKITHSGEVAAAWKTGKNPERLFQVRDGSIMIGFRTGEVATLPVAATPENKPVTIADVGARCTFLYEDRRGALWVGTNNGLFFLDRKTGRTFHVKGLSRKNIRSVYASAKDELWITTYGDGIFFLTENKLIRIPLDDRKHLAYAHCIQEDKKGNFWISSNKGLFRVAKKDLTDYAGGKLKSVFYMYYNKDHGFLTNEFNGGCQPCGLMLGDGHFSFPSMNGLVWFKPENVPLPYLNAPIRFESFELDNKPLAPADTLRLPHDFAHLTFNPVSPFLGLPDNLDYFYKLIQRSGTSTRWSKVGVGRGVDIYRLDAGTYTLVVRKVAGFGGKFVEKKLVLIVGRAWYFSWWFYVMVVAALGFAFWTFTKWRLRSLMRQNVILSKKVEERTANLSKTLEELRISEDALKTQLQIQMRIIGVINHDLHSPLRYLSVQVPKYAEQVAATVDSCDINHMGSAISKSMLKVYQLADELLLFIKSIYNKKGNIVYESVSLSELLERKAQFFAELAQEIEAVIEVRADKGLFVKTNSIMFEILVHNLIDNALKHSYGHDIRISAKAEKGVPLVIVQDSGDGMGIEIIKWLSHSVEVKDSRSELALQPPPNLGLGLIIVREIAMLLNIRLTAEASEKGTTITLAFEE